MHPIIRNILAIVAGLIVGSAVNMGIISLSGYLISPPDGADVTTMEGLKSSMHLLQPRHFLMPFLAHALGTFAGAFMAALIAASNKVLFGLVIGVFFLVGGIASIIMLPSPLWFSVLDLAVAYLPMGYLGGRLIKARP